MSTSCMVGAVGIERTIHENKACALYALQPPPSTNWNKWNKRQLRYADGQSHNGLSKKAAALCHSMRLFLARPFLTVNGEFIGI